MAVGLLCGNTAWHHFHGQWRSLLTCSMAHLGPWGSFAKHSQVSGAKGPPCPPLHGNIACWQGGGFLWGGCGPAVWQYSMAHFHGQWRSLLTCSMVHLGPWGSFAKHSQVSEAKGSTSSWQYIACPQGGSPRGCMAVGLRCAAIQYGTASMDTKITADLFHGSLGSMGQLCNAFPSL